jgi:hypothetical protein
MNNAHAHLTDESPREIGSVFNTPLVISGFSWLPVTQIIVWPVMTWLANRYLPDMSF